MQQKTADMKINDVHIALDLQRRAGWEAHQQALTNLNEIEGLDALHAKYDSKIVGLKKALNKAQGAEAGNSKFEYNAPPKTVANPRITNITIHQGLSLARHAIEKTKDNLDKRSWTVIDPRGNKPHKLGASAKKSLTEALKAADELLKVYAEYGVEIKEAPAKKKAATKKKAVAKKKAAPKKKATVKKKAAPKKK